MSLTVSDDRRGDEYPDNSFLEVRQPEDHISEFLVGHSTDRQFLPESRHGRIDRLLCSRCNSGGKDCRNERENYRVRKLTSQLEKLISYRREAYLSSNHCRYMENKTEHWYPNPSVVLRDVDDMNRLRVSIWMRHRINFQDMGEKWTRRELVLQEMIKVLRELDIEYRLLPVDLNVRNMPTANSARLPSTWATFNC